MAKKYQILSTCFDKKGNVLSKGLNSYAKSNTWQKELSIKAGLSEDRIFLHSEVAALLKMRDKSKVHTLKIERYDHMNQPKMAFPCPSCQLAIKMSGVKRVIFTTEKGYEQWIVT